MKVAFLRSFTIEPVMPFLERQAVALGLDLSIWIGGFNTYARDILDPQSALYKFGPDIVILAIQTREAGEGFVHLIHKFRTCSNASLLVHVLDTVSPSIAEYPDMAGVYFLDRRYDHDERNWEVARLPFHASSLPLVANDYLRFLLPLSGRIAKALVVDLDNTLWDGIVGEGEVKIGEAHQALQRIILSLYDQGIILAICSKNNLADAIEVLENHPSMLLRPHHFAALRINWQDKAKNLREIASELNIGVDSLAFLDDSEIERDWVRQALPEVFVIDPSQSLDDYPAFKRLSLTEEDRQRGRMYTEQRQRKELQQSTYTLEEFYHSLETVVTIHKLDESNVKRIAQLTQRTNQFNLTTRRYTEQGLLDIAARGDEVYGVSVRDRFGDSGLVGVVIVYAVANTLMIDSFLLSCRVIGRTIETALLAYLVRQISTRYLYARYTPTEKNIPARDFLSQHQFQPIHDEYVWELDTKGRTITVPEWITLC